MAFDKNTFLKRAATSVVFVLMMMVGLLWNQWSFLLLVLLIQTFCWIEFLKLQEKICNLKFNLLFFLAAIFLNCSTLLRLCRDKYFANENNLLQITSLFLSLMAILFLLIYIFQNRKNWRIVTRIIVGGYVYITVTLGAFFMLRQMDLTQTTKLFHFTYPLFIIFTLWINDTSAYLSGSFFGKTPLTKISPKKTWEGFIGGLILSITLMLIINNYLFDFSFLKTILLTIVIVITGTIGDIFESKMKRLAGVKDSGTILPGHGGFLDRFDSLLFAAPFAWLIICFL